MPTARDATTVAANNGFRAREQTARRTSLSRFGFRRAYSNPRACGAPRHASRSRASRLLELDAPYFLLRIDGRRHIVQRQTLLRRAANGISFRERASALRRVGQQVEECPEAIAASCRFRHDQ